MTINFELKGRTGSKGVAEGEALVCREPFILRPVEDEHDVVNIPGHEIEGKSVKDKIMVLSNSFGCSMGDWWVYRRKKLEKVPKAIIYSSNSPYVTSTVGYILAGIPMVYGFGDNLFSVIESGDRIKVDANKGTIEVTKAEKKE